MPADPGVVVYFEVDDLDREVERLKVVGVGLETEPHDPPWHWREAHVRDPADIQICLFRAGDNRWHPPWRLSTARTG